MNSDLNFAPISELAQEIRQGGVSCVEVARSAFGRAQKLDHVLNSYITIQPEEAILEQARLLDGELGRGQYRGPLHGIPISIRTILTLPGSAPRRAQDRG